MADSVYTPGFGVSSRSGVLPAQRHSAAVRITHWIGALSFIALVISGIGILLSHPRFYWGETGGVGTPSLFDLPLPFMLGGPSGWGRYLHFQSAWLFVLNLLLYIGSGLASRHFQKDLAPAKGTLEWRSFQRTISSQLRFGPPGPEEALSYNVLQRITYLAVIFGLFPLLIWTGLAMSPALTSVFPALVTVLGGHQSARTIHFFAAIALFAFVLVHIVMVWRAGFRKRVGAMITGHVVPVKLMLVKEDV
jgi:thiosulfate reductase cytochrome b subunit